LIRVVTNLIKNSVDAIAQKQPDEPRISVRVLSEENSVSISVTDNGVGVSEEHKHKIFEPKFTTKSSGMGLGLAMVKNIVETYNGHIILDSSLEKGTTFIVTFPKVV
jgi:two-component system nitrogen regulation sensor histidine kinase NtrY